MGASGVVVFVAAMVAGIERGGRDMVVMVAVQPMVVAVHRCERQQNGCANACRNGA